MNRNDLKRIESLRRQLAQLRQYSVQATRRGDVRTVARLTAEAAQLNQQIHDFGGMAES